MRSNTSARADSLLVRTVALTKIYHKEVNENNCFVFTYKLPFFNQTQQFIMKRELIFKSFVEITAMKLTNG